MTAEASGEAPRPRVFGGYVLVKALGSGAMGDVQLARPIDPGRGIPTPVVVKRLHGELAKRKGFVARFRHEAAVAVAVDSPHVAKVYDVGAVGDTLYICMDYVAGWPLSAVLDAILDSGHHASIASVVDLIAGGLAGLDALHTAVDPKTNKPLDIVHRDLSPKNLMVGEDGIMRLIDLGLGKSNAQDWRTRTGVVMGSVGYMPPEQARGERVDARADVYAMGVVAFEMLALRNFIRRGPLPKMMEASASPAFVPPSRYRPDVPPGLDDVLSRALRADKEERHPSAKAFLDDLRSVVPSSSARGGMQSLLEDLFGSTRRDREEEIRALMMMPVDGDEFESRPTRIFGIRDGVLPPDLQPTEHRANPSQPVRSARAGSVEVVPVTTVPEGTAATQLEAFTASPPDTRVVVSSVHPESFASVDRSAVLSREGRGGIDRRTHRERRCRDDDRSVRGGVHPSRARSRGSRSGHHRRARPDEGDPVPAPTRHRARVRGARAEPAPEQKIDRRAEPRGRRPRGGPHPPRRRRRLRRPPMR